MFKLNPITLPGIDLRAFVSLVGQDKVNEVDANRTLPPLSKFAELVDSAFLEGYAYWHIYQAFYFEVPFVVESEIHQYQHASRFRLSCAGDSLLVKGLISGPYDLWKDFLVWATTEDRSQYMRNFANALFVYFRQFPYFQDLRISNFRDQTFGLQRVKN